MKLFEIYVKPLLMYASQVWFLGLEKDRNLIRQVLRKFGRRVAYRTGEVLNGELFTDLTESFENADSRMFRRIVASSEFREHFFVTRYHRTRTGTSYEPHSRARKESVETLFPWESREPADVSRAL